MDLPEVLEINGVKYYREPGVLMNDEALRLLRDLYKALWIEAYYDPYSVESMKFAEMHVGKIAKLNGILKFKR